MALFRIISNSLLAVVSAALLATPALAADQEFYELRVYRNSDAAKQAIVLNYAEQALVPALNRIQSGPVGVWVPLDADTADVYVLIPFKTLDQLASLNSTLAADSDYQAAAAEFLAQPKNDPAYQRIDSRLMKAFAGMPVVEVPAQDSADRILELRIYESHNEDAARRKVAMFNDGEIDIMKDVKMAPVFYGETLISSDVPNLTYMLSADSAEAHKEHWQGFLQHPEWDRMKKIEKYKGTVSKITSVMLKPVPASQI
jgi:hypothetical protein